MQKVLRALMRSKGSFHAWDTFLLQAPVTELYEQIPALGSHGSAPTFLCPLWEHELEATKEQELCSLLLGPIPQKKKKNNQFQLQAMTSSATNQCREGGAGFVYGINHCNCHCKRQCRCKVGFSFTLFVLNYRRKWEAGGKKTFLWKK